MKTNGQSSLLPRGYRLGKLGLSLVGSYLGYQVQNMMLGETGKLERKTNFQTKASRQVREELGAMKGPAMKLGQMVSLGNGAMRPEALAELANLQMRAPGMHASLARAQFKSALGKYPEELLREFDPEPFAAASLGQVHRAVTFDGEKVAVKIQYPAIRSAIESDLKLLRSATLPGRVTGHVPSALLDEIARGLLEETDYVHEAANLEFFRKKLAGFAYLSIPRVYPKLSGDRVLTMSFIEGISFRDFLMGRPSPAIRDLVGGRLAEMYYTQLHRLKALHADQHPGNFLFQPDGRIGLVDFGCVKRLRHKNSKIVDCILHRTWRQGEDGTRRFLKLFYNSQVPYRRAQKILPVVEKSADFLFPQGPSANSVVNFADPELLKIAADNSKRVISDKLMPAEFIFVSRAEIGLCHLLHELGARVDIRAVWHRVTASPPAAR